MALMVDHSIRMAFFVDGLGRLLVEHDCRTRRLKSEKSPLAKVFMQRLWHGEYSLQAVGMDHRNGLGHFIIVGMFPEREILWKGIKICFNRDFGIWGQVFD